MAASSFFKTGEQLSGFFTEVDGGASSSVTYENGVAKIRSVTPNFGMGLYYPQPLEKDVPWTLITRFKPVSGVEWPFVVWDGSAPVIRSGTDAASGDFVLRVSRGSGNVLFTEYFTSAGSGARNKWDGPNQVWEASGAPGGAGPAWRTDDYLLLVLQNDGANQRFRYWVIGAAQPWTETNHGQVISVCTDWVLWSSVLDNGGDLYAAFGWFGDAHASEVWVERVHLLYGGAVTHATIDGRLIGAGYQVYRASCYGGIIADRRVFLPDGRPDSPLIPVGTSGAWDDSNTRHGAPAIGPDGRSYIAYIGNDVATSVFQVGLAHANTPDVAFTKAADNPILPLGGGGEPSDTVSGVRLRYDETDQEWKLTVAFLTSGSVPFVTHLYTNPEDDPTTQADWTYVGQLIGAAGTGYRQDGVSNASLDRLPTGDWDVRFGARGQTSPFWSVARFSGPVLDGTLAEDANNPLIPGVALSTTLTAGATNTETLTVGSTTGLLAGMLLTCAIDSSPNAFLIVQIQRIISSTQLALGAKVTLANGARIIGWPDASIDNKGAHPDGAGGWAFLTANFGHHGSYATSGTEGEWNGEYHAATRDADNPTFSLENNYPMFPIPSDLYAGGPSNDMRSYENPSYFETPIPALRTPPPIVTRYPVQRAAVH